MTEFNSDDEETKVYTLSKEALSKLLTQSFRNGVLSGYQSLYDSLEMNVKEEHFQGNAAMFEGFNYCKSLIGTMVTVASSTLSDGRTTDE